MRHRAWLRSSPNATTTACAPINRAGGTPSHRRRTLMALHRGLTALAALSLAGVLSGSGLAQSGSSTKAASDKSAASKVNTVSSEERASGWRLLFDGQTT